MLATHIANARERSRNEKRKRGKEKRKMILKPIIAVDELEIMCIC